MSVRVYVGNLPKDIEREQLEAVFAEHAEEIVSVKLVTDRKTGKCRGFGFVTVKTDEQADALVTKFSDFTLQESTLKIEKALPRSKKDDGDADSGRRKSPAKGRGTEGCFIVMRGNPEGIVFVGAHGRAPLAETEQSRSRIFFRKHESALALSPRLEHRLASWDPTPPHYSDLSQDSGGR
jgi:RNA recognition motif-containing protein